ncbi:hypothetical protein FIBSPDRAFT_979510 [Athelia psychrophila]|uniref:Uncharacterized protein n=1 Tax=Athelia psychrophila TaxID=1759441 RepID=A0A166DJF0_9AGAM|nr:hypothetical protein FIBSPDRAFT_979510 [Fibularhizoctonia sp. CBS 109695]
MYWSAPGPSASVSCSRFRIVVSVEGAASWASLSDDHAQPFTFVLDIGVRPSWLCNALTSIRLPSPGAEVTFGYVISATVAILALNAAFLLYICIAVATDKFSGKKFLPIYPGDASLSAPRLLKSWCLWGTPRTPTERVEIISHCTDYVFRFSVFRKHTQVTGLELHVTFDSFEPTIWAIFRGIMTVYACVGIVVLSVYPALAEAQLRGTLIVQETINTAVPYGVLKSSWGLSVASFIMAFGVGLVNPEQIPPPTLTSRNDWQNLDGPDPDAVPWQNPTSGFWANNDFANFNISWSGEYYLVTWVTSFDSNEPNLVNLSPGSHLAMGI